MTLNRFGILSFISALAAVIVLSGCGGSGRPRSAHDPNRFIREHNLGKLPRFDIPIEINDRVVAWMEYFQGPGRKHFQRYMERSGRYVPLMQEILKKNGMPADLIYIAMIESGFNTQARSWANAVGPWQFIGATGRRYGMRIDSHVDERRDPYRSTQAAVDYFRDLYGEFKDWYLAMAGYNAGEGTVRRAIASTGSRNFWEIAADRSALRPETRDYVPKFIAAAIMAKTPERFGFEKVDYRAPFDFDVAQVETQTDLGVVAKCAGVSEDDIVDLNPHLIRGATPPGERNYQIRLPRGTQKAFKERYAALPPDERITVVRYEVRKGDTLSRVARRYGVSQANLAAANGLNRKHQHLKVGSVLTIPSGSSAAYASASDEGSSREARSSSKKSVTHRVKKGETVGSIARRYGVSSSQLMAWNNIRKASGLRAGMALTVKGAAVASAGEQKAAAKSSRAEATVSSGPGQTHKVAKGETLSTIASRYGVTTRQLMELNNLPNAKMVRAGQGLVIRKPKAAPQAPAADTAVAEVAAPAEGQEAVAEAAPAADTAVRLAAKAPASGPADSVKPTAKASRASESASPAKSHKVGKGDTLGAIAAKYGVTTKELMEMNKITNPKSLRAGQNLVVKAGAPKKEKVVEKPQPPSALPALPAQAPQKIADAAAPQGSPATPQAAPASPESLSDQVVPLEPQTTAVDLRERDVQSTRPVTNVASANLKPQPSAPPRTAVEPAKAVAGKSLSYKVKGGDTLWDIARRHKVTIAEIQKWNNLSDPSSVKPGTTLKINKN